MNHYDTPAESLVEVRMTKELSMATTGVGRRIAVHQSESFAKCDWVTGGSVQEVFRFISCDSYLAALGTASTVLARVERAQILQP